MNLMVRCGLDLVKAAASLSLYRVWMKTARQCGGGGKTRCVQALHSSGCLKGKAKPLSMAAILMQDSEQLSGHSASYNERRQSQMSLSQPDFGDG